MLTKYFVFIVATILLAVGGTWIAFTEGGAGVRAPLLGALGWSADELCPAWVFFNENPCASVKVGAAILTVRPARTPDEQGKGLGGIERLREDEGMLYVYPRPDFYIHSMKDMRFPLDIIWVGADKKIVDYITDVQPESYPDNQFVNDFLAQYVFEVNAGFFDKHNLKLGDSVEFSLEQFTEE